MPFLQGTTQVILLESTWAAPQMESVSFPTAVLLLCLPQSCSHTPCPLVSAFHKSCRLHHSISAFSTSSLILNTSKFLSAKENKEDKHEGSIEFQNLTEFSQVLFPIKLKPVKILVLLFFSENTVPKNHPDFSYFLHYEQAYILLPETSFLNRRAPKRKLDRKMGVLLVTCISIISEGTHVVSLNTFYSLH